MPRMTGDMQTLREIINDLRDAIEVFEIQRQRDAGKPVLVEKARKVVAEANALDGWLEDAGILPDDLRQHNGTWFGYGPQVDGQGES